MDDAQDVTCDVCPSNLRWAILRRCSHPLRMQHVSRAMPRNNICEDLTFENQIYNYRSSPIPVKPEGSFLRRWRCQYFFKTLEKHRRPCMRGKCWSVVILHVAQ